MPGATEIKLRNCKKVFDAAFNSVNLSDEAAPIVERILRNTHWRFALGPHEKIDA
jgi:hypothetical protein